MNLRSFLKTILITSVAPSIIIPVLKDRTIWRPSLVLPPQACTMGDAWTAEQIALYNRLDFYLAKMEIERRKEWTTWANFVVKRKWEPNMGSIMRVI